MIKIAGVAIACCLAACGGFLAGHHSAPQKQDAQAACLGAIIQAGPPNDANGLCPNLSEDEKHQVMVRLGVYLVEVVQNG
jgi:hypothetical protein